MRYPTRAIFTKYIGATNTKPARIKAHSGDAPTVTIGLESDYDSLDELHTLAAFKLAESLQWRGEYIAGTTPDGLVFVNVNGRTEKPTQCNSGNFVWNEESSNATRR